MTSRRASPFPLNAVALDIPTLSVTAKKLSADPDVHKHSVRADDKALLDLDGRNSLGLLCWTETHSMPTVFAEIHLRLTATLT